MEPTSHQPYGSRTDSANSPYGTTHSENTSPADGSFSTTAAHATGDNPYPTNSPAQPDGSLKGKLDSAVASGKNKLDDAVASGKKWLNDSGVAEQAQQLPQKAKDLGNQAWTSVSGLTNTQKAVGVGILAAGIAFLAVRSSKSKKQAPEYRDRPRKSPFDHQPSTKDGDHAYDRRGQRPWGNSRYGTTPAPAGKKPRVTSGSGYTSSPSSHSADFGRSAAPSHSSAPTSGQRRDQGPASGSKYDANKGGSQNPNNIDDLSGAF